MRIIHNGDPCGFVLETQTGALNKPKSSWSLNKVERVSQSEIYFLRVESPVREAQRPHSHKSCSCFNNEYWLVVLKGPELAA